MYDFTTKSIDFVAQLVEDAKLVHFSPLYLLFLRIFCTVAHIYFLLFLSVVASNARTYEGDNLV